jgi:hypothetical protein
MAKEYLVILVNNPWSKNLTIKAIKSQIKFIEIE